MRTDGRPELVRAWLALEDQMAQEEAARVAALGTSELHAEMRADGLDPKQVPTAEQLMAGARAKAEERHWRRGGAKRHESEVVSVRRPRRRGRQQLWLAAAAVLVVAGAVAVTQAAAIVAWMKGTSEEVGPDKSVPAQPTPHEVAEKLRDEAERSLGAGRYEEARRKLDAAWALDPAGDESGRVQGLREQLREKTTPPPRLDPKTGQPY
jgi:hypothetical protein